MAAAVILGRDPNDTTAETANPTLDALFRRAAARRPDALALADPPDRAAIVGGTPRRLTFAEAARAVAAMAAQLRALGLRDDDIVGLQMPNTVESVLTLLAVLRAGLIASPLPLLWRRADAASALRRLGAKALIVGRRVGSTDHAALAMTVAAEVFPIRHVLGFGDALPDGMIALDDSTPHPPLPEVADDRGAHVAIVTWDVTPAGLVPVARSHAELIAGGALAVSAGAIGGEAAILTTIAGGSFAGLATAMVPWLITGGRLHLHHPFDAASFITQVDGEGCDTLVVPGPLAPVIADAGLLPRIDKVLALWRAPERLALAPHWPSQATRIADILAFGEIGIVAASRDADGRPAQALPPDAGMKRAGSGTLALRGAMVPRYPFPPGSESLPLPHLQAAADGFVDTGYPCRIEPGSGAISLTGSPVGLIQVGGYRFATATLHEIMRKADPQANLAPLPDALAGHRLAGLAPDAATLQHALDQAGINPLIAGAFADRRPLR